MLYATLETRKNKSFGTSLLLANRPMSPKIINGSFASIFENNDVLFEFAKNLSQFRYCEGPVRQNNKTRQIRYRSAKCLLFQLVINSEERITSRLAVPKSPAPAA